MLTIGSVVAGTGLLLVGLLALLFRHPRAPRWTRPELVAMLMGVVATGMIGFGLGQILRGVYGVLHGSGEIAGIAVLVAVAAVVAIALIGIRRRLAGYAAGSAEIATVVPMREVTLSTDAPPRAPTPGRPPRRPSRKAA